MKLINPTDDELNAAFAEKVAGWQPTEDQIERASIIDEAWYGDATREQAVQSAIRAFRPHFTRSMDAVLPWLEKSGYYVSLCYWNGPWAEPPGWCLSLWENDENGQQVGDYVRDKSLPRACVIALLRVHGVDIE